MMTGVVNANREATIRLVVIGPSGQQQEIEAIIDTGFTGFSRCLQCSSRRWDFPGLEFAAFIPAYEA